jgi:hypothetical protein
MSFIDHSFPMSLFDLSEADMLSQAAAYSPTSSLNGSRQGSPSKFYEDFMREEAKEKKPQDSRFLRLPVDIFKCVLDYLDRDAAWALKRTCQGMCSSKAVDELLYRYPIQLEEIRDLRMADWNYRRTGKQRWVNFQESVNDANRHYVQKLAVSHWASIADFQWMQDNLPALTSLDLTAIKDFVWTPCETWSWKELADACSKLFARIEDLEVCNWADYGAHSRIEYNYSYDDYRFKQPFRISRRRDGGSIAKMVFPACTQLKTLGIRERYAGFHTWSEWEVHQRACSLVDGIIDNCPPSMTKLRVYDYASFRSLFSTDVSSWQNMKEVEIGVYSWMKDRRDRDPFSLVGPIPYRITPGHHHRTEEDYFDDKIFEACERDHMDLGQHVVQGIGPSFEDMVLNLRTIMDKYPHININPIKPLRDTVLHPFHMVNLIHRNGRRWPEIVQPQQSTNQEPQPDPISSEEVQDALRWLAGKCDWRPVFAWDNMMCDVFPANLESRPGFPPKTEILSRLLTMFQNLKALDIPLRISMGDRSQYSPVSGLDGSLYFGDYKTHVGEGDDMKEVMEPTQARFNLTGIAHLVDELTIQYAMDVPGIFGWARPGRRPTEAEIQLIRRELVGWRRFWARYAHLFTNLKKLSVTIPTDIYNDWDKSEHLGKLLADESWQMLEGEDQTSLEDYFGSCLPSGVKSLTSTLVRRYPHMRFVQRVFFREETDQLQLEAPIMADEVREERNVIPIDDIKEKEGRVVHRFWPAKTLSQQRQERQGGKGKRGADDGAGEGPVTKRIRIQ